MVMIHTDNLLNNFGTDMHTYSKSFKYAFIKGITATVPNLAPYLMNICKHIKDFLYSFWDLYTISHSIVGPFSIKNILSVS